MDGGEGDHEDEDGEKKEEEKEEEDTMTPLERKIYIIDQIRYRYIHENFIKTRLSFSYIHLCCDKFLVHRCNVLLV